MPSIQGLHVVMLLLLRGLLPLLPADGDAKVDFLPRDLVARLIVEQVVREGAVRDLWLTAGDRAMSLRSMLVLGVEWARRELGKDLAVPRMVAPEMFDRLIRPVFLPALPGRMRRSYFRLLPLVRYLNLYQPFPSSLPGLETAWGCRLDCDLEDIFLRNLQHLAWRYGLAEGGETLS
jgi:hypothetical protein